MTKQEFYHRLPAFKHDPPGEVIFERGDGFGCGSIFFGSRLLSGEWGRIDLHSIQSGDYSKRETINGIYKGYKETATARGNRLLAKYQRWYKEWLAKRKETKGKNR